MQGTLEGEEEHNEEEHPHLESQITDCSAMGFTVDNVSMNWGPAKDCKTCINRLAREFS